MDAQVQSSLFRDHRRGRRLSAGPSPCRRIPRDGVVPSQACSICGASSTSVAARAFCVATDIMLHHRFPQAKAADLRRRGAASVPFVLARSWIKRQVVALHRRPPSPARTRNLRRFEDINPGYVVALTSSIFAIANPRPWTARGRATPFVLVRDNKEASQMSGGPVAVITEAGRELADAAGVAA